MPAGCQTRGLGANVGLLRLPVLLVCTGVRAASGATMRQGIHPLMRTVTFVMRNGASVRLASVMNHPAPYFLQVVSGAVAAAGTSRSCACALLESRLAAASTVCLTPAAARAGHHHQPAVDGAEGGAQPGGRTDSAADEALRRCAPCSMAGIGAPTCGARAAAWQPGAAWRGDAPFQRRVGAGPGPRSGAQTLCYVKAGVRLCNGHNNPFRCTVYCRVRGGHGGGDGG